jgi:hypothetical protein
VPRQTRRQHGQDDCLVLPVVEDARTHCLAPSRTSPIEVELVAEFVNPSIINDIEAGTVVLKAAIRQVCGWADRGAALEWTSTNEIAVASKSCYYCLVLATSVAAIVTEWRL